MTFWGEHIPHNEDPQIHAFYEPHFPALTLPRSTFFDQRVAYIVRKFKQIKDRGKRSHLVSSSMQRGLGTDKKPKSLPTVPSRQGTPRSATADTATVATQAQENPRINWGEWGAVENGRPNVGGRYLPSPEDTPEPCLPDASALEQRKQEIVDKLMSAVMRWLNLRLEAPVDECEDGDGPGPRGGRPSGSGSGSGSGSNTGGGRKPQRQTGQKRQFRGDEEDEANQGDGDGEPGSGKRMRRNSNEKKPGFACPIFKKSQGRFIKSRACCGPGWQSIHRMKEHLYRQHTMPKYRCNRCCESFGDNKELAAHQRAAVQCPVAELEFCEDIDEAQEQKLRARAVKDDGKPEEEKWRDVYKILYPDTPDELIPSPYYDYSDDRSTNKGLRNFQEYLQRDLPPRLRRELEQEVGKKLHCVEKELQTKVVDIFKSIVQKLVVTYQYQETGGGSGGRAASPPVQPGDRGHTLPAPATTSAEARALAELPTAEFLSGPDLDFVDDFTLNEFLPLMGTCVPGSDSGYGVSLADFDLRC